MDASPHHHLQSAALPYRHRADGTAEVLLISTSTAKRWGIPKGTIAAGHTFASSAAKEAFEEAGVEGDVAPHAEGRYHARKRTGRGGHTVVEVWVHLMRVTRELPDWPERNRREVRWCPARTAARMVDEPFVANLCRRLAQ